MKKSHKGDSYVFYPILDKNFFKHIEGPLPLLAPPKFGVRYDTEYSDDGDMSHRFWMKLESRTGKIIPSKPTCDC